MDYNWLLTTIAQSSAALVGISAGFLILRISLYINKIVNISSEIKFIKSELNKSLEKYNQLNQISHGLHELFLKNTELKESWDKKQNELKNQKPPKRIIIGIIGVFCLIGFGIYYPIKLIPQNNLLYHFTWGFSTISFLKWTFWGCLFILIFYLITEIYEILILKVPKEELNNDILEMLKFVYDRKESNNNELQT